MIDIYALGLLLLELRFGYPPFWYLVVEAAAAAGISEVEAAQRAGEPLIELARGDCPYRIEGFQEGWDPLHEDELAFLRECLPRVVSARAPAADLLRNVYIENARTMQQMQTVA